MMQTTNHIAFRVPDSTQNDGYQVVYLPNNIPPRHRQAYMSAMRGYLYEDPAAHSNANDVQTQTSNNTGIMTFYPPPEVLETDNATQSGGRPAAQHVLNSLPDVVLLSDARVEECTICLQKMCNEAVTCLPCDHLFHKNCIILWLCNNNTCPLCRFNLPIDEVANQA